MAEFRRSAAVPQLEARRSCQEITCYRPHSHDALSIGAIDAGSSLLTGPMDGAVRLEAGDVVVVPAGQVHACNPAKGHWLYQMLHVDQDWSVLRALDQDADRLWSGISVLRGLDLHARLSDLIEAIFTDQARSVIEVPFAGLCEALAEASPTYVVRGHTDPDLLALVRPVLDRLRDDASNPALDELAASVGMSKYQLIRAVRRATGLTPMAWRQNARIGTARRMLREGRTIIETAHQLGFTDQSHFHGIFRSHVAASPGAYVRGPQ